MLMNYHIGRLVLSSLCVGDLVRLVLERTPPKTSRTNQCTHIKFFILKLLKIAPTCFDHAIIIREFLAKITLLKHSLIDFPIIIWCCGSMSYCVGRASLRVRLTV